MKKIDTVAWQNFSIGNLFEIKKGTRLIKANMRDGDYPFIGASAVNNGITAMISNAEHLQKGNTITISYNGSVGEAFYQDKAFWASDDVNVLYPKFDMNKYIALFIIPVLKRVGQKYAFIDKWKKEDMEKDQIRLPVDMIGNPNFSYMEAYMKKLETAVVAGLAKLQSAQQFMKTKEVVNTDWKEFKIIDLFEIVRPMPRSQSNYEKGDVPFVASGNYNNGVLKYLKPKKDEQIDKGNCISVSPIDGSAFYQESDFMGRGGAGSSVILLYNSKLNKYNGIFIATVIRQVCSKYIYNNMANKDIIAQEIIKLPVDELGNPDYVYMTNYMIKLESQVKHNMSLLARV